MAPINETVFACYLSLQTKRVRMIMVRDSPEAFSWRGRGLVQWQIHGDSVSIPL
jgi:hypothetical protein